MSDFCATCGQNFDADARLAKAEQRLAAKEVEEGGHAFPVSYDHMESGNCGMSLRDYFAAKAMQGFCAASGGLLNPEGAARDAYAAADAMLKARQ